MHQSKMLNMKKSVADQSKTIHGTITSELPHNNSTQVFKTGGITGLTMSPKVGTPMRMAISQRRNINRGHSLGGKEEFQTKKLDMPDRP